MTEIADRDASSMCRRAHERRRNGLGPRSRRTDEGTNFAKASGPCNTASFGAALARTKHQIRQYEAARERYRTELLKRSDQDEVTSSTLVSPTMKLIRRALAAVGLAVGIAGALRLRGKGGTPPQHGGWQPVDLEAGSGRPIR